MATIKTEKRTLPTGEFTVKFNCDAGGNFSAKLPAAMTSILGIDEVEAESLSKCQKAFNDAVKRFTEANTTKRKLICYEVRSGESISFSVGMSLCVAAAVYEETKITGENVKTRFTYAFVDSEIPREMHRRADWSFPNHAQKIEWTQEREDFFVRLFHSMERVTAELRKLNDPGKCMEIAAGGVFQLEGGKRK